MTDGSKQAKGKSLPKETHKINVPIEALLPPLTEEQQALEQTLIGALFGAGEKIHDVQNILTPADFYDIRHGYIFEAMLGLANDGLDIDLVTTTERLRQMPPKTSLFKNRLEESGGFSHLGKCAAFYASSFEVESYAHQVKASAITRKLLMKAYNIMGIARQEHIPAEDRIQLAKSELSEMDEETIAHEPSLSEIVESALLYVTEEQKDGVKYFIDPLDNMLGEAQDGDFIVPAARTGVGKTRFKLQVALMNAKRLRQQRSKRKVMIMTTEVSEEQILWILAEMQSRTGFTVKDIRSKAIKNHPEKLAEYNQLMRDINTLPLRVVSAKGKTVEWVRARLLRDGVGTYALTVVDYIQELRPSPGYWSNRSEEVGHRAWVLKTLAGEAQTVIMAASQFNREGAGNGQGTQNISQSDEISHRADFILAIEQNETAYKEGHAVPITITVAKGRFISGKPKIELQLDPQRGTYQVPYQPASKMVAGG